MTESRWLHYMKKMKPYNMVKGVRYLRHFGWKEFCVRLSERMEPEEVPYGPWYENYRPTEEELNAQRACRWEDPVTFSIIVPVFRTPEKYLREMIDSVLGQTCPHWELCIANADPADETVNRVLREYTDRDTRIKVKDLVHNSGIAENTNEGLDMAEGDFIALLDHDDTLDPSALYHMQNVVKEHPETDLIYTDEDKINGDGTEHFQPHLKPDFNPDLLRSNNYICHFTAVRRSLVQEIGGFRSEFNGAQDYDFILRCSEKAREIHHVSEILYHWRTHAASTADNPMSKSYAYDAGQRAIEEHLKRIGVEGRVEQKKDLGFYRVTYPVQGNPLVSIVIPNKDHRDILKKCLDSVFTKSTYKNIEVIIVENGSEEPETFAYYEEVRNAYGVRILTWDKGFNYSAINNFGIREAKGDYLICLNNDIEVITPGWIEELLGTCQRPGTGIVGCRLYYPDNTVQHAGIVVGIGGVAGSMFVGMKRERSGYLHKAALMQDLSAVTAACMIISREAFEAAGGFEERLAVAFNDVDLCLKVCRAGYRVVYDPYAEMYHWESKSRGIEDTKEKVRRFQTEIEYMRSNWTQMLIEGDPCYNKNLSRSKWNYSLRAGERMQ